MQTQNAAVVSTVVILIQKQEPQNKEQAQPLFCADVTVVIIQPNLSHINIVLEQIQSFITLVEDD